MATNTLLTPTQVLRKALMILHQKLNFIGSINRQYDDQFAQVGGKIGNTLKIRLPNQYKVRTGKNIDVQGSTERSIDLVMATQKGVDIGFSSQELTLDIDDFAARFLDPAMAVLSSNVEADMLNTFTPLIYQQVGTPGTVPNDILFGGQARAKLNQSLAPKDNNRRMLCDSATSSAMVKALSGLFQDSSAIAEQYREGMLGRTSGFDWYENESIYAQVNGDHVMSSGPALDTFTVASGATSINLTGLGNTKTVKAGTVFTVANVFAVNPETKRAYSALQQFVVSADVASNAGGQAAVTFTPAMIFDTTDPLQNINAAPTTTAAVTFVGAASTTYSQDLAFHRDFATFVSADLEMPEGVHFAAREQYDGISMRIVRAYDINSDNFPCRIDVLYGGKVLRPELACRVTH